MPASVQKQLIDTHLNSYVAVRGIFRVGSGHKLVGIGHFEEDARIYRSIVREEPEGLDQWRVPLEELDY